MYLSHLQRYILLACLDGKRQRRTRAGLERFYDRIPSRPRPDDQQNAITKSLERLIDKGLLIGYGRRTPKKWFIEEIALTPRGRKEAKRLLGEQQQLPFKQARGNKEEGKSTR